VGPRNLRFCFRARARAHVANVHRRRSFQTVRICVCQYFWSIRATRLLTRPSWHLKLKREPNVERRAGRNVYVIFYVCFTIIGEINRSNRSRRTRNVKRKNKRYGRLPLYGICCPSATGASNYYYSSVTFPTRTVYNKLLLAPVGKLRQ